MAAARRYDLDHHVLLLDRDGHGLGDVGALHQRLARARRVRCRPAGLQARRLAPGLARCGCRTPSHARGSAASRPGASGGSSRACRSPTGPTTQAEAERRALMRAAVDQREEFAAEVEHADLAAADGDDLAAARGDLRAAPHGWPWTMRFAARSAGRRPRNPASGPAHPPRAISAQPVHAMRVVAEDRAPLGQAHLHRQA